MDDWVGSVQIWPGILCYWLLGRAALFPPEVGATCTWFPGPTPNHMLFSVLVVVLLGTHIVNCSH